MTTRRVAGIVTSVGVFSMSTACAHSNVKIPLPLVPYSVRADTSGGAKLETPSDDAARTLGIPVLWQATLPPGARELRISGWWGMIFGSSLTVVRLIELPGQRPVGQLLAVWPELKEWSPRGRPLRCTEWKGGRRTCAEVVNAPSLDWVAIARRLDELGAWTISATCEVDGHRWMDAGDLFIARLISDRFDRYDCNAPSERTNTEARAALRIATYVDDILKAAGGNH